MSSHKHPSAVRAARAILTILAIAWALLASPRQMAMAGAPNPQLDSMLPGGLSRVYQQLSLNPSAYPHYTTAQGIWLMTDASFWTSGFWPGELWLAYELSGTGSWITKAQTWTNGVQSQQSDASSHDVGYKIFPPFMNGYRLTGNASYRSTILTATGSMATRYSSTVGCIKTFEGSGSHAGQFPVEIDNVPTLEMLLWAARNGGQASWRDMAINHALRTQAEFLHSANDGTYHVVWFNPSSGAVISRGTMQGYSDTSTWSRGHAWGIYGFVMCYRETGDSRFLATAQRLADYYLSRLPADMIPPWDFDAPSDPPKDSSAAAIVASALLDLSRLVQDGAASQRYWDAACNMLITLCSSDYLSNGINSQGILLHGTGHWPHGLGIDVSQIWGDHYFVQAIDRYRYLSSTVAGSHTSSAAWQNLPLPLQRGEFSIEYDVVPSTGSIDGITAISTGPGGAYSHFGVLVRFNTSGTIDVRNGADYQAETTFHYTAGTAYHFRLDINVPGRTCSVYVTPSGGSEVRLASNHAFRTEQGGATYLDNLGLICEVGSHQVSNVRLGDQRVYNLTRDTWHVTVQGAIDAAVDGNVIVLDPGTYTGAGNRDIDFKGKAITVRSTDPDSAAVVAGTVIDCQGSPADPHRGFKFHNTEGSASVLKGLTITNGYAPAETINGVTAWAGGGICSLAASPTILSCVISACTATGLPGEAACGGGVFTNGGSFLIDRCTVSGNSVTNITPDTLDNNLELAARGGGIYCLGGTPVIRRCTIDGNRSYGGSSNWYVGPVGLPEGGGIYCDGNTLIEESTVAGNSAESAGFHTYVSGGGVWCAGQTVILNCTIDGNSALHGFDLGHAYGGGISSSGALDVSRCTITENVAWHSFGNSGGGGICCASETAIDRCLVAGNSTYYDGTLGGGIFCAGVDGPATVINCIIVSNAAWSGGGLSGPIEVSGCTVADNWAEWAGSGCDGGSVRNCIFWGNTTEPPGGEQVAGSSVSYSCIQDWTGGGIGNIASDPGFLDPDGADNDPATWSDNNYRLAVGSPCINMGDPVYTPASGETDLDGRPRLLYGQVDMGAYEFLLPGDGNCDGYVNVGDLQVLVTAWGSQKTPPSSNWNADTDFNNDGYCNVGDLQVLVANWARSI